MWVQIALLASAISALIQKASSCWQLRSSISYRLHPLNFGNAGEDRGNCGAEGPLWRVSWRATQKRRDSSPAWVTLHEYHPLVHVWIFQVETDCRMCRGVASCHIHKHCPFFASAAHDTPLSSISSSSLHIPVFPFSRHLSYLRCVMSVMWREMAVTWPVVWCMWVCLRVL